MKKDGQITDLADLSEGNRVMMWLRHEVQVLRNLIFSNSLYLAIFFMLLDWMVNMNYLTAVYPIVIFCYILVQNPLQLPLIQTDEEGIVYEQDRLTLGMVAALVQWVMENGGAKDKATSRDQSTVLMGAVVLAPTM